jgi:hypothetical protein
VSSASFGQIIERSPLASGTTGALFQNVRLTDGCKCIMKHLSATNDAIMRILRDRGSNKALWTAALLSTPRPSR